MTLIERFESKTERITESGCWIWLGCLLHFGYGGIKVAGKMVKAHRLSWELYRGEIPDGMCVLHRCDVASCCNPDHLFLGTLTDNASDRDRKGRQAWGAKNGHYSKPERTPRGTDCWKAKLTEQDVLTIRNELSSGTLSQRQLSRIYGVGDSQISAIKKRLTWKHI